MSYDIRLFLPVTGEDPVATAQRDEEGTAPLTVESRNRNALAIAALKLSNPSFEVFEFDYGVQLTAPDDGTGISVELFAETGAITVPYWHKNAAGKVLAQVSRYVRIHSRIHRPFGVRSPNRKIAHRAVRILARRKHLPGWSRQFARRDAQTWWRFW